METVIDSWTHLGSLTCPSIFSMLLEKNCYAEKGLFILLVRLNFIVSTAVHLPFKN